MKDILWVSKTVYLEGSISAEQGGSKPVHTGLREPVRHPDCSFNF